MIGLRELVPFGSGCEAIARDLHRRLLAPRAVSGTRAIDSPEGKTDALSSSTGEAAQGAARFSSRSPVVERLLGILQAATMRRGQRERRPPASTPEALVAYTPAEC